MTSENCSFQWPFKVSEICLKGMQQIKKHLFKKIHSVSVRTVRAYGTWARTVPSLPLSSAWWMLHSEQVWPRSSRSRSMASLGEGSLPAFLISYPQCHVTKAKLLVSASKRSEAPFLHPIPTPRMEILLMHMHSRQRTQGPCCPCLCLLIGQRFGAERQVEKSRGYHPCPAPLRGKQSGHKDRELWNSPQRNWLYLEHSVGKLKLKNAPENNGDFGDKRLREGW